MSLANGGGCEAKANRLGAPPTALASGSRVFLIKAPRMVSVLICDPWENKNILPVL